MNTYLGLFLIYWLSGMLFLGRDRKNDIATEWSGMWLVFPIAALLWFLFWWEAVEWLWRQLLKERTFSIPDATDKDGDIY